MAYIGVSPSNGVRQKHTYTATASQTTFSGAGSEGISLSYRDSNYVDVYRNGVKLGDADYTATSGTSIVLGEGAAVSDIIEIVTYDVFSVADTVSKADGGTFDGNVTMAGTLAVTGETTLSTHLNMGDNDIIKLGDSADLQIYHDPSAPGGATNFIKENGGIYTFIQGNTLRLRNRDGSKNYINMVSGAGVDIYYDNAPKLATTSTGIDVTGTVVADGVEVDGLLHIDGSDNSNVASFALTRTDASWSIDNETNFRIYGNTGDTTNPATKRFEIGTGGDISFYEDTGTSQALFWDASAESLGIGTTSPTEKLQVNGNLMVGDDLTAGSFVDVIGAGTNQDFGFRFGGESDRDSKAAILANTSGGLLKFFTSGDNERMLIDSSGNVGIGQSTIINSASGRATLTLGGSLSSIITFGNAGTRWGGIYASVSDYSIFSDSLMRFEAGGSERMRISSSGNVGIGTTSPDAPLHIIGNDGVQFNRSGQTNGFLIRPNASTDGIRFTQGGTGDRMTIDSSGNVGIGTSSPGMILDVDGSSAANDIARFSGSNSGGLTFRNATANEFIIHTATSDALIFGTNGNNERMRIDSSGSIAIGSATVRRDLGSNTAPVLSLEGTFPAINLRDSGTGEGAFFGLNGDTLYIGGHTNTATMQFYVNGSEKMRIAASGDFLVGTTSMPSAGSGGTGFQVDSNSRKSLLLSTTTTGANSHIYFMNPNGTVGNILTTGSSTTYNTSSDGRLKDITGSARGLEVINELNPVAYNWKADGQADEGLIAQEVLDIVPNAVSGSEEEQYYMDYSKLVVHLVAGMKEQQTQIETLKQEIREIKESG